MFEEFDKNDDGKLSKEEYTELWGEWCYGCEASDIREMVEMDFDAFDENEDGYLSVAEVEAIYAPAGGDDYDWDY